MLGPDEPEGLNTVKHLTHFRLNKVAVNKIDLETGLKLSRSTIAKMKVP